jgi:1-pyrroline-5-carboxylate dehydrogenase
LTKDPKSVTMVDEIFGPVITVSQWLKITLVCSCACQVYVFEDADYEKTLDLIDTTTEYALTGSMYDFLVI